MRGIASFPGTSEPRFVDVREPDDPGPGQVLCRTLQLGVCGTDREILHSEAPLLPPGEGYLILGHECLARVEAVGPGVTSPRVGELVIPVVRRANLVDERRPDMLPMGRYRERGIVEAHGFSTPWWLDEPRYLFRVEPELAPLAVLTEPMTCGEKGIRQSLLLQQARLGEETWRDTPPRVLVTGMGPIGFSCVMSCLVRGWPTTMYGRDAEDTFRARLAVELGARYLRDTEARFPPDDVEVDGYDLVLECTGSSEVMLRAASAIAARGVMVWLGSTRRPRAAEQNVGRMMRDSLVRNHLIIGSVNAADSDFENSLRNLAKLGRQRPGLVDRLITARVTPDDALWHYEQRAPQGIKTVVMFE